MRFVMCSVLIHVLFPESVVGVRQSPTSTGIAQQGEHLPYKQRVIGSSPVVGILWNSTQVAEGFGLENR